MRAVTLDYQHHTLGLRDIAEPSLRRPNEVLFRVREAGVCGTDRELTRFRFGVPPPGESILVLGHEVLGSVETVGSKVAGINPRDWVVPMIRRACVPACVSCARGRRDLCITGRFTERGIFGEHGYLTELAVDAADDLVVIPAAVADRAVLVEPLSVVEKAAATALRLHEPGAETALVLGAGPIGILAALVLTLRGLDASLHSLEASDHPRARLVEAAGIRYLTSLEGVRSDVVIEATGDPAAALSAIRSLAPLGVCVILGASMAEGQVNFLDLVVKNQIIAGSVNADPESFRAAVSDIRVLDASITRALIERVPLGRYEEAILGMTSGRPKVVLTVNE